ncbi:type III-A CRISPR-associated RAMP protein Csm4 [Picrophilus oshimae]|uniref:CRISPR system Cms protein Csm4 n=1 Tax=Picrophilus torridus (strain ATCC 700027 / DSM 9790 / JCM 10055 / NBRC 100828 / KAW 2/3) TaxID=1122961 RepID=Q6L315_PICTO|nr:type III-A CRISPR-associated RAMP protein Csm4 [Picrophilus oshimae]AAT42636.1 hypothetical protein PTO0051 [Picrophilus oshimae DSM 9789]
MTVYKIRFKSSSTVVDSIKISGAIINSYSILYPDKLNGFIESIINNEHSFSGIFPFENGIKYPIPAINNIIDTNLKREDMLRIIRERKNIPKYINEDELKKIIKNYIDNNITGVEYHKIFKSEGDRKNYSFVKTVSETGINIYEKPVKTDENRWKYNDVFSKELYRYNSAYFIVENSNRYIDAAINLLEDFGISGRRNTGKGNVDIQKYDDILTGFNGEGFYLLLSSFIPVNEYINNIDFERSRYNLKIFQGKDIKGKPLGPFLYFAPGSLLYLNDKIKGMVYKYDEKVLVFNPVIRRVSNEI